MASITLGGATVHTVGDPPTVGDEAPDFTLTRVDLEDVSLSAFAGERLILNVFPSVETGICAATTRYFNEAAADLPGVKILTISKDTPFALKRFRAAEGIDEVIMLSGIRSSFGDDYGVTMEDGPFAGLYSRLVFVLDASHRVVYVEQVPEIGSEPDYAAALEAVAAAPQDA